MQIVGIVPGFLFVEDSNSFPSVGAFVRASQAVNPDPHVRSRRAPFTWLLNHLNTVETLFLAYFVAL